MDKKTNEELQALVAQATAGDKKALETLVAGVQDIVFNLSLRMLGTFADAEDATQDILLRMITHLSSFRGESAFTTWVFGIAVNHLRDYRKHMFGQVPLMSASMAITAPTRMLMLPHRALSLFIFLPSFLCLC